MSALNPAQRLSIALIGPGLVGRELLRQIYARFYGPKASSSSPFSISVVAVATSKRMVCLGAANPGSTLDLQADWRALLNDEGPAAEAAREALVSALERQQQAPATEVPPVPVLLQPTDLAAALSRLSRGDVLVDCSASSHYVHAPGGSREGAEGASPDGDDDGGRRRLHLYGLAMRRGVSVVTPNKCFAAGPAADFRAALLPLARPAAGEAGGARPHRSAPRPTYLGEATVGAGLPVLSTLRDLLATGDRVRRVEGVFSGSLSFIFNTLSPSSSVSEGDGGSSPAPTLASVVRRARDLGYTEPDPRDDLSGLDVARKAVILARALSLSLGTRPPSPGGGGPGGSEERPPRGRGGDLLELADVPVRSLVPAHLSDRSSVGVEAFLAGLATDDGGVGAEAERARLEGRVLRYVGVVTVGGGGGGGGGGDEEVEESVTAEVALRSFPRDHPYAGLSGADNVFSFVTERYAEASPLVVRGPGAGAAVTAAGVFADLLTVARAAGATV